MVAQGVRNLPAVQETWARSLGQEYHLEKGMATHFNILAWKIPWIEKSGGLQLQGVERDWATNSLLSIADLKCADFCYTVK